MSNLPAPDISSQKTSRKRPKKNLPKAPKMLVTQSNRLVEANYNLTVDEKRLILTAISIIHSKKEVPEKIDITAIQYASIFKIDLDSAYSQLKKATNKLYERDIYFNDGDKLERIRWVDRATYHNGEGKVSLYFTSHIRPFLGQINRTYSAYHLELISELSSFYSIRIFELIHQYKTYMSRWITIEKFREMLGLQNKYPRYTELRRSVIEKAVKEINKKTIYNLAYQVEKQGRKVTKIWFFYTKKTIE